ncbi:MAG: ABC transporter ATP-binding protein [Actinomycetaceae bacterium]|nr:ABC transporter ATP-binding protein [Actinomycetaceae bacterium]
METKQPETDHREKHRASREALKQILTPINSYLMWGRILAALSAVLAVAPLIALTKLGEILLHAPAGGADPEELKTVLFWLIMAFLNQAGLYVLALAITHFGDAKLRSIVQGRIIERIAGAPLAWFSDSTTGRVRKAIQDDTKRVHQLVAHAPVEQTAAVLTPIMLLAYAFVVDWRLGLLAMSTLPVFLFLQSVMMRGMGEKTAQMDDKLSDISTRAVELTDGIHVVKNFGQTGKAHGRYIQACEDFAHFYWDWCGPLMRGSAVSLSVIAVPTLMLINLGGGLAMVSAGWVTIPQMLTASLIALVVPHTVEVIGNTMWAYQQAGHAALRLQELLHTEQTHYPETGKTPSPDLTVRFEDVTFTYHEQSQHPAVNHVDLTLQPGTVTALIGASGSGKSTLATMLARFRDPDSGCITIGEVDIRDLSQETLYRTVSFVLQDPQVQRRSIRDIVALARPDASDSELRQAARKAQILEEIEALPNGWDTVVGEDTDLSGGQKQRLAIARAIVADTPILVLDEATAATDPDCEAQIQAALAELAQGRTVLVIAHHAESVRGADQICVMELGSVAACGSAQQLEDNEYWQRMLQRSA